MNLNNVVAVRNIKTVYRDGDKSIKVFNEDERQIIQDLLDLRIGKD